MKLLENMLSSRVKSGYLPVNNSAINKKYNIEYIKCRQLLAKVKIPIGSIGEILLGERLKENLHEKPRTCFAD